MLAPDTRFHNICPSPCVPVLREVIWHGCRFPCPVTHAFLRLIYTISHSLPKLHSPRNCLNQIAVPIHTPPKASSWFPLPSRTTPSLRSQFWLSEQLRRIHHLLLAPQQSWGSVLILFPASHHMPRVSVFLCRKCFSSAEIPWFLLVSSTAFLPGILVQYGGTRLLPEADLIGVCLLCWSPLLDWIVNAVSQVSSWTATLVVPEILGPDCCRSVILFSLSFLTHVVAAMSEVVKMVPYERERLNVSLPPEKDPDVGKPLPPGCR